MSQKLSSLAFNGPGAKTKTVLEMACKMNPKSSIIQSVSDRLGHFVSIYSALHCTKLNYTKLNYTKLNFGQKKNHIEEKRRDDFP